MSADNTGPHAPAPADGIKALRAKWGWIFALGVISVVAGVLALGSVVVATEAAVMIVGVMMLSAGFAEIVAAFGVRDWGHFLFWMLLGVFYSLAGFVCLADPFEGATILTLLGVLLAIIGLLRIYLSTLMQHGTPWGWVAFSGVLSFLVGLMIIGGWPSSSFFVLGLLLGMDLIYIGTTWVAMGLALKHLT